MGKPDAARIIGHGFANGIAHYQLHRKHGVEDMECSIQLGLAAAKTELDKCLAAGQQISEYAQEDFAAIDSKVRLALMRYPQHEVLDGFQIIDVERVLEDSGNSRIDLYAISDTGIPAIIDYKYKNYLKVDYLTKTRQEYDNHWNMLHYLHYGSQHYQRDIYRYYIVMVVGSPKYGVYKWEYNVHPDTLKWWYDSAVSIWAEMDAMEQDGAMIPMSPTHHTRYGQCEMYKMCFNYQHDESIMSADYVKGVS